MGLKGDVMAQDSNSARPPRALPTCTVEPLALAGCERREYAEYARPFPPHSHDHYVIGIVRDGRRLLTCNGEELDLAPGDVIALNPGDVHGCSQCGGTLFSYESVVLPTTALDGTTLPGPRHRDSSVRLAFEKLVRALRSAPNEKSVKTAAKSFARALPADTNRTTTVPLHNRNRAAALHAYDQLKENASSPQPVSELAKRERLSACSLTRAYKKAFSITPSQRLLSMRVDLARDLLARGMGPSDVAAKTGFSDQSHLTRAFKQRIGSTPAAYRSMVRGRSHR